MEFRDTDRWQELLQIDPNDLGSEEFYSLVSSNIRELCLDLNTRGDRLGIAFCLKRLKEIGQLLEEHNWLDRST